MRWICVYVRWSFHNLYFAKAAHKRYIPIAWLADRMSGRTVGVRVCTMHIHFLYFIFFLRLKNWYTIAKYSVCHLNSMLCKYVWMMAKFSRSTYTMCITHSHRDVLTIHFDIDECTFETTSTALKGVWQGGNVTGKTQFCSEHILFCIDSTRSHAWIRAHSKHSDTNKMFWMCKICGHYTCRIYEIIGKSWDKITRMIL